MKKWDKWKKRILAFVVTGCMLLDSDMAVLAEETQKVVSNLYDEYQTEQLYKKQYEETVGQVQPEQSAENNDDSKKNLKMQKFWKKVHSMKKNRFHCVCLKLRNILMKRKLN